MANHVIGGRPLMEPALIEQDQRLSQSMLWQMQRAFYQRQGVEAWSRGYVPFYITNNPVIAGAYARVVLGYLRDFREALDLNEPIYIVELGSGTGRFGYLFLQRLLAMLEPSGLSGARITYLLTDIAPRNLDFWRSHPQLQPYLEAGQLDLAVYDPVHDPGFWLDRSGKPLTPDEVKNPLVVIANYFFDSIPQDVFGVNNGMVTEGLVSLATTRPGLEAGDPEFLPSLLARFRQRFAPADYYPDAVANQVLQGYARTLHNTYLQFPYGAMEVVRRLCALSQGRMLMITGDRGYYRLEDLRGRGEPEINLHGGVVSMQVNFHAVAEYFRLLGGQAFHASPRAEGLVISTFLLGGMPGSYGETRLAFQEAVEMAGPDDFFQLKKAIEGHYEQLTVEQLLALIRISRYDATLFAGCAPALASKIDATDRLQGELVHEVTRRVWEIYYPIGEEENVYQRLAQVFLAVEAYADALECLTLAERWHAADEETGGMVEICRAHTWDGKYWQTVA